jgi:hypothetical protein
MILYNSPQHYILCCAMFSLKTNLLASLKAPFHPKMARLLLFWKKMLLFETLNCMSIIYRRIIRLRSEMPPLLIYVCITYLFLNLWKYIIIFAYISLGWSGIWSVLIPFKRGKTGLKILKNGGIRHIYPAISGTIGWNLS